MKSIRQGPTNQFLNPRNLKTSLYRGRQTLRSILFAILALLISSCASTSRMADPLTIFSSATGEAAVATKAALDTIRTVDIEKSAYNASSKDELSEESFPPFLTIGDIQQRVLVLDALATYANKMKQLAGLNKSKEIKKNFADLKTNLDSLSQTIESVPGVNHKLPDGVLEALTLIGEELVNLYVAHVRNKAISDALEKTDPYIKKMCDLISSEYSNTHGTLYDQLQASYRTLQTSINEKFKTANNKQRKLAAAKEYGLLLKKKELGLALFASIADSYTKIASAHNALLLQSTKKISSEDQLKALSLQIECTKFFYVQLVK
jgi:hypothetical protein